jgi:hypothetical protein
MMRTSPRAAAPKNVPNPGAGYSVVRVTDAHQLCRLQAETREMGRSIGLSEASVFEAVIAVSELAHRLYSECPRGVDVELAAVRLKGGLGLDVRAECSDDDELRPPVSARLVFAPCA